MSTRGSSNGYEAARAGESSARAVEEGVEGEGVVLGEEDEGAEDEGVDEIVGDGGGVAGDLHARVEGDHEDGFEGRGVGGEESEDEKQAEDDFGEGKQESENVDGESGQPAIGELILNIGDKARVATDEFRNPPEENHEADGDAQERVAEATRIKWHGFLHSKESGAVSPENPQTN